MKEVLYQDNWRYLQRAPVALESKFQRMAEDPYKFMRGNLSIQVAHWSRLSQDRMTTSFLKKDGSESLFVHMADTVWSVDVPESVGEDTSYARIPDGGETWENGVAATPGVTNQ